MDSFHMNRHQWKCFQMAEANFWRFQCVLLLMWFCCTFRQIAFRWRKQTFDAFNVFYCWCDFVVPSDKFNIALSCLLLPHQGDAVKIQIDPGWHWDANLKVKRMLDSAPWQMSVICTNLRTLLFRSSFGKLDHCICIHWRIKIEMFTDCYGGLRYYTPFAPNVTEKFWIYLKFWVKNHCVQCSFWNFHHIIEWSGLHQSQLYMASGQQINRSSPLQKCKYVNR